MEKQYIILKNLKLLLLVCAILGIGGTVAAVNPFVDIEYPVEELGNCQNKEECKQFCDNSDNKAPCLDFAKKMGLVSEEEAQRAGKMIEIENEEGPGGCIGKEECEAYCDRIDNMRECIEFAEENGLIPPEELEQGKKVLRAIDQGITPPNCNDRRECDIYCSQVEHMEECIEFGIASGMMPPEEQIEAKKMLEALKVGIKPPNCNGKEECDIYCSQVEHMEECIEFGIASGMMPPEEQIEAKKMLEALKAGVNPPNCRGDKECDEYCRKPENMAECMEFSIIAGFAPPEEIEMMKKTLEAIKSGVMPPNCSSDEECRIYCQQEEHMEECINFSVATGFMTEEEAEKAKKSGGKGPGGCTSEEECHAYCDNPGNARECINFGVMMGDITQEKADRMIKEIESGAASPDQKGSDGMAPDMQMIQGEGPGGCTTPEECDEFCSRPENKEECSKFGGVVFQTGEIQPMPGPGGPGMMSPEDEERLKQQLQQEYGDEWQTVYDEKMRQIMLQPGPEGGQPSYAPGTEGGAPQPYGPGPMPPQDGEWQEPLKGEDGGFQFTPGGVNQVILDTEQKLREGFIKEGEQAAPNENWIYEEGNPEPVYREPYQGPVPEYGAGQGGDGEGQWININEQPQGGMMIENKIREGQTEYMPPPVVEPQPKMEGMDSTIIYQGQNGPSPTDMQPKVEPYPTEPQMEPMPKMDDQGYNVMPGPTYTEPVQMLQAVPEPSNTEPAPAPMPVEPMPSSEPAPMIEPGPIQEPATEAPQSFFEPFRKFLGAAAEFISSH